MCLFPEDRHIRNHTTARRNGDFDTTLTEILHDCVLLQFPALQSNNRNYVPDARPQTSNFETLLADRARLYTNG